MKPKKVLEKLIFDKFHENPKIEPWEYEGLYELIKTAEYYGLYDLANEMKKDIQL